MLLPIRKICSLSLSLVLCSSAAQTAVSAQANENQAFNQAMAALNQHNYPKATQLFEKLASSHTPTARLTYYCALANLNSGNKTRAEQLFTYVVKNFPTSQEAGLAQTVLDRFSQVQAAATPVDSGSSTHGSAQSAGATAQSQQHSSQSTSQLPAPTVDEAEALPQTAKIRFTHGDNGHMVVDAYLNGHPIKAWFDTGASAFISTRNLQSAGINPPTRQPDTYTRGWAGVPVGIWRVPLEIRIGDLTRHETVSVQKSNPDESSTILPLFGQDFVKGYHYSIDEAGGVIVLTKNGQSADSSPAFNPAYDVPCIKGPQDDYIPLQIGDKKVVAFVDTGASRTIIDSATFNALGMSIPSDAPYIGMSGVGGGFTCREVEMDLKLGPIKRQGFKVLVGGTAGNAIGQDFMRGWRFTVDHDRNLLRFFH